MQIKNPTQGLFDIVDTDDPSCTGHPALLWHHGHKRIVSLAAKANARLRERPGIDPTAQSAMLAKAGRLQLARELGHAPQRLAAVLTDEAMLGVRSWITLRPKRPAPGKEEALCLWLNSTPGLLLRILRSNRPYLGRSTLPQEVARGLPVIDVDALASARLGRTPCSTISCASRSKASRGWRKIPSAESWTEGCSRRASTAAWAARSTGSPKH